MFSNDVDEFSCEVNKYRQLEDRLVLVPVAVILVPMAGGSVSADRRVAYAKSHQLHGDLLVNSHVERTLDLGFELRWPHL